jgi:hypothetical protein
VGTPHLPGSAGSLGVKAGKRGNRVPLLNSGGKVTGLTPNLGNMHLMSPGFGSPSKSAMAGFLDPGSAFGFTPSNFIFGRTPGAFEQ